MNISLLFATVLLLYRGTVYYRWLSSLSFGGILNGRLQHPPPPTHAQVITSPVTAQTQKFILFCATTMNFKINTVE